MRTIYIKGIKKYKESLIRGLNKSDLREGKDFIQGLAGKDHALYWINDNLDLRIFKLAIGAKYVWKHRMKFYNTIEEMNPVVVDETLSESEIKLMERVKREYYHAEQNI